jgi:N-acetyl-anhydromuramyl-L-alanine amidase AmpD
MATISNGKLIHCKVSQKIYSQIERGFMPTINGIVVHQTDTTNVSQQFNTLAKGKAGAHFVIDKKGSIFQTARVNQKVDHTGKIKSRCYETKTCSTAELKNIKALYFQKGVKFAKRVEDVSDYEKTKSYP